MYSRCYIFTRDPVGLAWWRKGILVVLKLFDALSLTPALSRWERENCVPCLWKYSRLAIDRAAKRF